MSVIHKIIAVLFVPISAYLLTIVCKKQPQPYMDEVFHYPQALKYYRGNFTDWDPKITTPPGLYFASNIILVPLSKALHRSFDSIACFRSTNLLFTIGNVIVIYHILQKLHQKEASSKTILLSAVNITIFPLLYFYTFLFYTDCGAGFFVLLMYLLHLNQHQWMASVFGAISILFRQTNIIWMFFVAAHSSLQILTAKTPRQKGVHSISQKPVRGRSTNFMKRLRTRCLNYVQHWAPVISDIIHLNLGYLLVGFGFVFFLAMNKSLVLGDKSAHKVGFNLPQLCYFLLFSLCFASPFMITLSIIKKFFEFLTKFTFFALIIGLSMALCIKYLTHEHPYLLADNRHYTFYIWRRILNRNEYVSYMLIPLYVFSGWVMYYQLRHKDVFWKLLFMLCVILSIVPQRLLELRYFTIPFIMFRLHAKLKSFTQVLCELLLFISVNAVTMYLFLEKPFFCSNNNDIQRFMW